jgi:hypothetical protein
MGGFGVKTILKASIKCGQQLSSLLQQYAESLPPSDNEDATNLSLYFFLFFQPFSSLTFK